MAAHILPLMVKLLLEREGYYMLTDEGPGCLSGD
jgi:hypothetical protein